MATTIDRTFNDAYAAYAPCETRHHSYDRQRQHRSGHIYLRLLFVKYVRVPCDSGSSFVILAKFGDSMGACACDVNRETWLVCMTRRQALGQSGVGKSRTCRFPYGQQSTLRLGLCESMS